MLNFIKTFLLCLHLIDARIIYNHIFLLVKSQIIGALFFCFIYPSHRLYTFLYYCRLFYTSNLFNALYALSCYFNNKKIGRKIYLSKLNHLLIQLYHFFIIFWNRCLSSNTFKASTYILLTVSSSINCNCISLPKLAQTLPWESTKYLWGVQ